MSLFVGRGSLAMVARIQGWGVRSFQAFAGGIGVAWEALEFVGGLEFQCRVVPEGGMVDN